jgi:phosphatidylserine/phosphatidylglycerophosphate/cardiolipin synthase-like enzyme
MFKSFQLYWDSKITIRATQLVDIASPALKLKESDYANLFNSTEFEELRSVSERADSYSIVEERGALKLYPVNRVEYVADWPEKKKRTKEAKEWDSTSRLGQICLQAEKSILVQTPYLIQDFRGIRTMKAVRKSNPELDIVLSTNSLSSADMFYVYGIIFKQRQLFIETLGCRMFEFRAMPGDAHSIIPRFSEIEKEGDDEIDLNEDPELLVPLVYPGPRFCVHAKFFVVDERISAVGSHNFDPRAKNINTENSVIVWDENVSKALKKIFERDTAPQNSWVVARRQKPPVVGQVSDLVAAISSSLPVFDIWPFDYSSNFDLREKEEPVRPSHPDFYSNYKDVGVFPEVGLSPKRLGGRFTKAFGGVARGLM